MTFVTIFIFAVIPWRN